MLVYKDDKVEIQTTEHDYDFIASVLNKTNSELTLSFPESYMESIAVPADDWIGLEANADGYTELDLIQRNCFQIEEGREERREDGSVLQHN